MVDASCTQNQVGCASRVGAHHETVHGKERSKAAVDAPRVFSNAGREYPPQRHPKLGSLIREGKSHDDSARLTF